MQRSPSSTLFPYATLFRSVQRRQARSDDEADSQVSRAHGGARNAGNAARSPRRGLVRGAQPHFRLADSSYAHDELAALRIEVHGPQEIQAGAKAHRLEQQRGGF